MNNPWILHVLQYKKKHNISFGEALVKAQHSYTKQKGSARKPRLKKYPKIASRLSRRVFVISQPNDKSPKSDHFKAAILSSLPDHRKVSIAVYDKHFRNITNPQLKKNYKKTNQEDLRKKIRKKIKKKVNALTRDGKIISSVTENNSTLPMCKNQVNSMYIFEALSSCHYMFLMYSGVKPTKRHPGVRGRIRGFALVNIKENSVYLDVLCGEGGSKKLIEAVEQLGRDLGKSFVELYALEPVIGYYFRQQYFPIPDDGTYEFSEDALREIDIPKDITAAIAKKIKFDKPRVAKMIKERINKQVHTQQGNVHPKDCVRKNGTYDYDVCGNNGYRMVKRL